MESSSSFKTEQEQFWKGDFGDAYTDRNNGVESARANLIFWSGVLKRTGPIQNCFEIGCNRGLNLDAIKTLLPSCETAGLEINSYAAGECARKGHKVFEGSILDAPEGGSDEGMAELSFACGVLIHVNPESLVTAYDLLYKTSRRFILMSEYFNPTPIAIPYRGHKERLFKRDFAADLWTRYADLRLVDYGFIWSKDPVAPKDDTTWFLFQK